MKQGSQRPPVCLGAKREWAGGWVEDCLVTAVDSTPWTPASKVSANPRPNHREVPLPSTPTPHVEQGPPRCYRGLEFQGLCCWEVLDHRGAPSPERPGRARGRGSPTRSMRPRAGGIKERRASPEEGPPQKQQKRLKVKEQKEKNRPRLVGSEGLGRREAVPIGPESAQGQPCE